MVCGRLSYVTYVQKAFWIQILDKQLLTKYQIFTKIDQNFTYS